jgi:hypothetical protein
MPELFKGYAERQEKIYGSFEVIGAGLPRTGTMCLRSALGTLLKGSCHHMSSLFSGTDEVINTCFKKNSLRLPFFHTLLSLKDCDFWLKAISGEEIRPKEWVDMLEGRGFRAGVDYPISLFYRCFGCSHSWFDSIQTSHFSRELMEAYPKAKVILTVRSPDTWYKSVYDSIYMVHLLKQDFAIRMFTILMGQKKKFDTVDEISLHPPRGFDKGKKLLF